MNTASIKTELDEEVIEEVKAAVEVCMDEAVAAVEVDKADSFNGFHVRAYDKDGRLIDCAYIHVDEEEDWLADVEAFSVLDEMLTQVGFEYVGGPPCTYARVGGREG